MHKKEAGVLYARLLDILTQHPDFQAAQLSKKTLRELMQGCGFRGRLSLFLANDTYFSGDILALCQPVMERLCPEDQPEDWLFFVYDLLKNGLFPQESAQTVSLERLRASLFYLGVYRLLLEGEQTEKPFSPDTHFQFATSEECKGSPTRQQYAEFLRVVQSVFFVELMRIGRDTMPFDMLGHVAGVHHVAMRMARQLKEKGAAVDLPLISAAAATHDIGKYGCKGEEQKRIPYLHYYYTEQWLMRYGLNSVAHVAANHSTWDLELENLPAESLLLIYADFRVKSVRSLNERERMRFLTLAEAYAVILGKLDNVDEKKRLRYERVYRKLADFEAYMVSLGVNTDPFSNETLSPVHTDAALLEPEAAVTALKFQAISHNLKLMHRISSEPSFADILEDARTQTDWQNIRAYIDILSEYFTYMTQKQKSRTMRFLYELFMHSHGDIRYQAATLYARILAGYDTVYRKELPPNITLPVYGPTSLDIWRESLSMILLPDHKIAPNHSAWISYTLKVILPALFSSCKAGDTESYLQIYLVCFENEAYLEPSTAFVLLDSLLHVPASVIQKEAFVRPLQIAARLAALNETRMQAAALRLVNHVLKREGEGAYFLPLTQSVLAALPEEREIGIDFLFSQAARYLNGHEDERARCELRLERLDSADLFLENLKTATPWITKEVNIAMLLYRVHHGGQAQAFQVAAHVANLIRVSERFAVRNRAGEALLELAPVLTLDQRNEIAVELVRGLESASHEFSKYIPQYLGQFMLYLHPKEMDESLSELIHYIKSSNEHTACVTVETVGVLLQHYTGEYRTAFSETEEAFEERKRRMLGMLLSSLAHHNEAVARVALFVLGKYLFGGTLTHGEKSKMFRVLYKKLLLLIIEQTPGKLTFFSNAASLNHIYRFIVEEETSDTPMVLNKAEKAVFFPGTFDPFSASHLGIVSRMRALGFEVYLALDEFSWSKHTQPHMVRRRIANMSVADAYGVYLFPEDIPVNIANPADLERLKALFPGRELYIAAGSDVVKNASAYKSPPSPGSIHSFHHVIFLRGTESGMLREERELIASRISGSVIELMLPPELEEVSSTSIRESVDHNRDISALVDPTVQGYIYDNGLYLREPQDKELLRPENMHFESCPPNSAEARKLLFSFAFGHVFTDGRQDWSADRLTALLQKRGAQLLLLRQKGAKGNVRGIALYYATSAADLFAEFENIRLAEYVRRHASGKIAVLAGIYVNKAFSRRDTIRLLLNETLALCLGQDYTYAMLIGANGPEDGELYRALERQGFLQMPDPVKGAPVYAVDMRAPIAVVEDIHERIKMPLSADEAVVRVLREAHERFSSAMAGLYPGRLVLSFHAGVLNHALISKVMRANGVDKLPENSRDLGEHMCVPYGKTLRGMLVPNTVTKSLHVEKIYEPDMKGFHITEYPGYATLINQIRTIKSFGRPVLLVDDLLHKGYRLEALDPLFKEAELDVKQIIVGLMSGRGKDLMSVQGREADCVYFIPNLRYWFVESELYPFIGGDSVERNGRRPYLLPSVNQILPYTAPSFISGTTAEALFTLSLTCLKNSREILRTLERRHQELYGFNLTLRRLGEVLHTPRVPDRGGCMRYDRVLSPSVYVENDIEQLLRLEPILKED
ncbi:MAG TPA: hypothetical protein VN366_05015 [Feifaniaceae bacterium]|nr:hypothetical protein [Feifaniaceae bacterium]